MLLVGFDAYGGRGINPAAEICRSLDGKTVAGTKIRSVVLPVRFDGMIARLDTLIDQHSPSALICVGLWPGEAMIRLERFGVNLNDFEIPDNDGAIERGPIEPEGPTARCATLPLEQIRETLLAAGIPARLSSSAGNFLCNAILYSALGLLERRGAALPCGFIHLPYMPEQVAGLLTELRDGQSLELHQRADLASMPLDLSARAVRMAIETTLDHGA
ncbi:hypothetical protein ACROSR_10320 [Roseovarius tibetensis]|uniref:pyroglutamyl-peptidase I family protein n=1 Tax=Roseovarius tibetensis TaxID=2685897 RepID=UPI003D7FC1C3